MIGAAGTCSVASAEEYGLMAVTCLDPEAVHFDVMCGPVWLPHADRELHAAYEKLLARLDQGAAARLQQSQREWVRYRDADVEVLAHRYGEADAEREARLASHLFRLTRERLRYLEARLEAFDRW